MRSTTPSCSPQCGPRAVSSPTTSKPSTGTSAATESSGRAGLTLRPPRSGARLPGARRCGGAPPSLGRTALRCGGAERSAGRTAPFGRTAPGSASASPLLAPADGHRWRRGIRIRTRHAASADSRAVQAASPPSGRAQLPWCGFGGAHCESSVLSGPPCAPSAPRAVGEQSTVGREMNYSAVPTSQTTSRSRDASRVHSARV